MLKYKKCWYVVAIALVFQMGVLSSNVSAASKEEIEGLIKLLEERDEFIRSSTVKTLGKIGPEAKDAVPALVKALSDENGYVRKAAVKALRQIGTPEGLKAAQEYEWNSLSMGEQRLRLILKKSVSDLNENDISELVRRQRSGKNAATAWFMLGAVSLPASLTFTIDAFDAYGHRKRSVIIAVSSGVISAISFWRLLAGRGRRAIIADKLETLKYAKGVGLVPVSGNKVMIAWWKF